MKATKIIIASLFAVLLLASCGTPARQRVVVYSFGDYRNYPDMWISPNPCTQPHQAIGDLAIDIAPAYRVDDDNSSWPTYSYEKIGFDELMEMAVSKARSLGANGISNFSIKTDHDIDKATGKSAITGYHVSGLLIKIEAKN